MEVCYLQEFFIANPATSVKRMVKQCCEAIRLSTQWLGCDRDVITTWLKVDVTTVTDLK